MSSALEFMGKPTSTQGVTPARLAHTERRSTRRCKINQLMRIRPSDPERDHFEDIRSSLSVSRSGVFFQSSETGYEVGMRLFVSMPYSKEPAAMTREYLAEVVRRENLPNGLYGIGFKILMEMGMQGGYANAFGGNYNQRK
ncbi:MAG: PilZ domain-containing protein [Candidatus Acidiferrum sp.]